MSIINAITTVIFIIMLYVGVATIVKTIGEIVSINRSNRMIDKIFGKDRGDA